MTAVPRAVLDGIATVSGGDDAVARDLIRAWRAAARKADEHARRIREQVRSARCRCLLPAGRTEDDRCSRCYGRVG